MSCTRLATVPSVAMTKCSHCGGAEIIHRLSFHQVGNANGLLSYKDKEGQWSWRTEEVLADLCRSCGTIVRLYVDNTDHPIWSVVADKRPAK
jgi:hypothetical protein